MAINAEKNTVTTSTRQSLGKGPAAMANQPGGKVPLMSSSTQVSLGRTESRMANLENRPGRHGELTTSSTMAKLSRKATPLYGPMSAQSPLVSGPGGGKKRR